jgi:hypothetical protein
MLHHQALLKFPINIDKLIYQYISTILIYINIQTVEDAGGDNM